MTLAGGVADKFGNQYEGRWTAYCMAKVMDDAWTSITIEPPDADKVEFSGLRSDGVTEHHQTKRRAPRDSWSLADLDREGLLQAIVALTEPGNEFHLVSGSPVSGGLPALADHARLAESFDAFRTGLGQEADAQFSALSRRLAGIPPERLWGALCRTHFRQVDDDTVRDLADDKLNFLINADPGVPRLLLGDLVLESLRRPLAATDLWRFLEKKSLRAREWGRDPSVRAAVEKRRERFIEALDATAIAGHLFPRAAASELIAACQAGTSRRVLLAAVAGMGKSVALREAVVRLAADRLVLPVNLDEMPATADADAVGASMGLPGSPALVLAHLAAGQPAVLVVDQLDAASQASGRSPQLLRAVDEMLRVLDEHPNISVLLACRLFDLTADPRLRRLRDRADTVEIELGPLPDEDINVVLESVGIDRAALSKGQREIIRVPLHLRLLAEAPGATDFVSELDLFKAYWAAKRRAVVARGGSDATADDVIGRLSAEMSRRQSLSVPSVVVQRWQGETGMLRSEHVLAGEEPRVSFFHETFFDFAFAQSFVASGQRLEPFLQSTDQGLFRRSQVRQILAYERFDDPDAYGRDLAATLRSPRVRFHIKALILAWLREHREAFSVEWDLVRELIEGSDAALTAHAVSLLASSPALFDLADDAGQFGRWLADEAGVIWERTVWILAQAQRRRPRGVAELLQSLDCQDDRVRRGMAFVVGLADLAGDETFFGFFLDLISKGCLDDLTSPYATNGSFWDLAHDLVERRPSWAAAFIAAFVRRRVELGETVATTDYESLLSPTPNPLSSVPDPLDSELFGKVAAAAPDEYVQHVLPVVLDIITRTGESGEDGRHEDRTWSFRMFGRPHDVRFGLIEGLEHALRRVATDDRDAFRAHRASLGQARSRTADHLLARAYTAAADEFAHEALAWLQENPRRLHIGYVDAPHWHGRELIAALWPHLSADGRRTVESMLLAYYPAWEKSVDGRGSHGYSQFVLLDGLAESELSQEARRRLQELRRKFGEARGPKGIVVGFVGSPIPAQRVPLMSDDQWRGAIDRYQSDERLAGPPYELAGGAQQLAEQLRDASAKEPSRFIRLLQTLPRTVYSAYPNAVLRGVAQAESVPMDDVGDLVRWCHQLPDRPCGRWICQPVARHGQGDQLPDDLVELVAWYATDRRDPGDSDPSFPEHNRGPRMALINAGINTTRGTAAEGIAALIQAGSSLDRWRATVERLVDDPSDAVRACAAEILIAGLRHDRDWVAKATQELLTDRPRVASSATGERLLKWLTPTHVQVVTPVIEALLAADDAGIAQVGGRLASLAAFAADEGRELAERAMTQSSATRIGAAEVYAANIHDEALRPTCRAALITLFVDADRDVRRAAGQAFTNLHDESLDSEEELVRAFVASPGIAEEPDALLDALIACRVLLPESTVEACRRVVAMAGGEAGSIASAWAAKMPDVVNLAVRVYVYGRAELRSAALDVVDSLAAVRAYGYDRALADFER